MKEKSFVISLPKHLQFKLQNGLNCGGFETSRGNNSNIFLSSFGLPRSSKTYLSLRNAVREANIYYK